MNESASFESLSPGDIRTAAVRGIRWTLIARPIVEVSLAASMIVLARLVSPAEFGRFAIALMFGELMLIPGQAVGAALVQRPKLGSRHLQTGMGISLLIGVGIAGAMLVAASLIIVPLFGQRTADLVRLSTVNCLVASTNIVPSAVLQRQLAFRRLGILDVVNTMVCVVASIGLALAGWNAVGLVVAGIVSTVAGTLLVWFWARPPLPRLHRREMRDIAAYGGPAGVAAMGWVAFRNCDYAIVGARLGALQAGFYFRAYALGVEYQKKIGLVMGSVGFPLLARAAQGVEQAELRRRMVRLLTVVLFPLLATLAVVAPVLVPWLFGREWSPAVVPTQILVIGGAATLVIDAVGAALMAAGRTRAMMLYGWGHFVCYAALVVVISPLGISAVAVAAAAIHSAFLVVAYTLLPTGRSDAAVNVSLAPRELWSDIAPALVPVGALLAAAVGTSRLLSNANGSPVLYVAIVSLAGLSAYVVALRALYPDALRSVLSLARHVLPGAVVRAGHRLARSGDGALVIGPPPTRVLEEPVVSSVTAIVTEYNEPRDPIERTVTAILGQSMAPRRVVLVDDTSPAPLIIGDGLMQRIEVTRLSENGGLSAARNHGAQRADTDYLLFVNCDVILDQLWVERALAFMDSHVEVGAVSGQIVPRVGPKLLRKWRLQFIETKAHRSVPDGPIPVTWIVGHVFFVRRNAFEEVGGFDPRFRCAGEDYDFSRRMLSSGHALIHLPELIAESYELASVDSLARKCVRNAGWDLRTAGRERPCAAVQPLRPVAATRSLVRTFVNISARNVVRGRFAFLPVDVLIAARSVALVWSAWLRTVTSRPRSGTDGPSAPALRGVSDQTLS